MLNCKELVSAVSLTTRLGGIVSFELEGETVIIQGDIPGKPLGGFKAQLSYEPATKLGSWNFPARVQITLNGRDVGKEDVSEEAWKRLLQEATN